MRTIKTSTTALALLLAAAIPVLGSSESPLRALLIDAPDRSHGGAATTPALAEALKGTGRFRVETLTVRSESDWQRGPVGFADYDAVVLTGGGPGWPAGRMRELARYVAGGGGLAIVHAALAVAPDTPVFARMAGLAWRPAASGARLTVDELGRLLRSEPGAGPGAAHDAPAEFVVQVRDPDHPINAGLPLAWRHSRDELYSGLRGPAEGVHVLATARAQATRANEPILWTVAFEQGRVFVTTLGHDADATGCLGFRTTMARGVEWAATGRVTLATPEDFPGPDRAVSGPWLTPRPGRPSREVIVAHVDPKVKVHGSYSAVQLPITRGVTLHNPATIACGPDGAVYVANYTGEIYRLRDRDGDGLEDAAEPFVDIKDYGRDLPADTSRPSERGPGLRYPTGLVVRDGWLYVATTQEIARFRDRDGDGQADQYERFASAWPYTMHRFDWTMGLRVGPDGWFYTNVSTDYLRDPSPDPRHLRGSLVRISPDGKTVERFAGGLRFAYDLAFNAKGDLFLTDNQGGGNPTEELNHAIAGGNYGHNPRGTDRPVTPRGPLLELRHGAGSAGLEFNPPGNQYFGPTAGDLFVAMWGHDGAWHQGTILRVELRRQPQGGYRAVEHVFAEGPPKVVDLAFASNGDLYVARFGIEGKGHTPYPSAPMGNVYRFISTPWRPAETQEDDEPNPLLRAADHGDPTAGRRIFEQKACETCHSIDGSSSKLGPDLGTAGRTFDRKALLDSIADPSANIKTDYDTHFLADTSGRTLSGRLIGIDRTSVRLMVPGNRTVEVPRDEVEQLEQSPTSLMPTDLLTGLTGAQVDDLIAYLLSLGAAESVVRLNCGGGEVEDFTGRVFVADRPYQRGGFGYIGGREFRREEIGDPLLRACRYGDFAYRFDVADGEYEVRLILGEPHFRESGRRVMSLSVQGKPAATNLDPLAAAGFGHRFETTVRRRVSRGVLDITASAASNQPMLSAIEVRRLGP